MPVSVPPPDTVRKSPATLNVPPTSATSGPANPRLPPAPIWRKSPEALMVVGSMLTNADVVLLFTLPPTSSAPTMLDWLLPRVLFVTSRSAPARLALAPEVTRTRVPGPVTVEPVICTTGEMPLRLLVPLNVLSASPDAKVLLVPEASETSGTSWGAVVVVPVVERMGAIVVVVVVVAVVLVVVVVVVAVELASVRDLSAVGTVETPSFRSGARSVASWVATCC